MTAFTHSLLYIQTLSWFQYSQDMFKIQYSQGLLTSWTMMFHEVGSKACMQGFWGEFGRRSHYHDELSVHRVLAIEVAARDSRSGTTGSAGGTLRSWLSSWRCWLGRAVPSGHWIPPRRRWPMQWSWTGACWWSACPSSMFSAFLGEPDVKVKF